MRKKSVAYQKADLAQFIVTLGPGSKADERWLCLLDTINKTMILKAWHSLNLIASLALFCGGGIMMAKLGWRYLPPKSRWRGSGSSLLRARWVDSRTSQVLLVSCFYFDSITTLKSHCFSLHERYTIADWWNAVSRLALVRSEAEQLMTYLIVSTSKILYPNCTSHTSCFVLQLTPILSHASFPDAWRLLQQKSKQPEKGPRWQLRGVRGEARTRITIN